MRDRGAGSGSRGGLLPGQLAGVPLHERFGVGGDVEVLVQTGIGLADLGLAVLEQQPVPLVGPEAGEVQPDDHALVRESVTAERVAHRPQRHERIEVLGGDLEPTSSPLAEGLADLEQIVTRARELVSVTAPLRLRCRLDNAEALELLEPLREQGAGEPGRTLEDLAEGLTAQMQVADDQRRPALSEDLRATGDRAVLAVGPYERSVPRHPTVVKSRFLTSKSRSLTSSRCGSMLR
jgi:hypothetical protein